jgi:hypothetical protein
VLRSKVDTSFYNVSDDDFGTSFEASGHCTQKADSTRANYSASGIHLDAGASACVNSNSKGLEEGSFLTCHAGRKSARRSIKSFSIRMWDNELVRPYRRMDNSALETTLKVWPCRSATTESQLRTDVVPTISTKLALVACYARLDGDKVTNFPVENTCTQSNYHARELMAETKRFANLYGSITAFLEIVHIGTTEGH